MTRLSLVFVIWPLLLGGLLPGCARDPQPSPPGSEAPTPAAPSPSAVAPSEPTAPPAAAPTSSSAETGAAAPDPQPNYFREGVIRAESAVAIGQTAQSPRDWTLAARRWQQAARLMAQVPPSHSNYAQAQAKAQEYQQNARQAEQRASAPSPSSTTSTSPQPRSDGPVAQIPVIDRWGGTPVVPVTLTGNRGRQQFPMLFDTGATFTLITPAMAQEIGVIVVDEMVATVADGRQVRLPVGYIDSLEVGGLVIQDMLVGIGGDAALLGQDVYGEYGISAGGSTINLYD